MKNLCVAIILLFTMSASAQGYFSKYLGNPAVNMQVNELLETYDGGFLSLISGSRTSLIKMNNSGDTLWTKDVGLANNYYGLTETSDHNILLSGSSLSMLDEFGSEIWTKQFNGPINGGVQSNFSRVVSNGTGGIMLTSESYVYWNSGNNYETAMSVYRFDVNGDTLWSRHLFGTYFNSVNQAVSIKPLGVFVDDNGDVYALAARSLSSDYALIIWKLDATGNTVWLKENVTTNTESIYDIEMIDNGNLLVTGYSFGTGSGSGGRVVQINGNGDLVWAKIIVLPNSGRVTGITQLHNGKFAVSVENVSIGSIDYQNGLYLTDSDLNVEHTILHGGESTAQGGKVIQLQDLSIINSTLTNAFAFRTSVNYQKVDTLGNTIGCFEEINSPPTVDVAYNISDLTMSEMQGGGYAPASIGSGFSSVEEFEYGYELTAVIQEGDCFGDQGSIDLSMNGTPPFEIQWSNGTTAEDLIDFSGIYSVLVEDGDGCLKRDTFELNEPPQLVASYVSSNVDCFGAANGSIDLSVSGGTPGYSYQWSTLASTEDLMNLGGGFYQCIISDANGCSEVIGVSVAEPQQLTAVILSTTNASCADSCDGELEGFAAGGTSPYNYLWNDMNAQTNATAVGLCNGNYLLTATDDNGCVSYANASIAEPSPLMAQISTYPSDCFAANGSAEAMASGGTSPYSYDWNGAGATTNDSIGGLDVGTYDVQVVDANGCTYDELFDVESNTSPVNICVVTVDTNNQNLLVWDKPMVSNVAGFNIYRNIAGVYTQIGYQPYDSISQYVDNDFGVDPQITSYRYKISVLDSCGNESALSDFHETIHLTANVGVGGEVNLIWDDYEGVSFSQYEIWRDTTGNGDWETIGNTLSTSFTFTDNTVPQNAVSLRYAIDVVLPSTCTAEKAQSYGSTRSNKQTVMGPGADLAASVYENVLLNAKVFPNPTNDQFTIALNTVGWNYQVMDVSGRVITSGKAIESNTKVDVSEFENGVYLVNIELNGQVITKKVVKQ